MTKNEKNGKKASEAKVGKRAKSPTGKTQSVLIQENYKKCDNLQALAEAAGATINSTRWHMSKMGLKGYARPKAEKPAKTSKKE